MDDDWDDEPSPGWGGAIAQTNPSASESNSFSGNSGFSQGGFNRSNDQGSRFGGNNDRGGAYSGGNDFGGGNRGGGRGGGYGGRGGRGGSFGNNNGGDRFGDNNSGGFGGGSKFGDSGSFGGGSDGGNRRGGFRNENSGGRGGGGFGGGNGGGRFGNDDNGGGGFGGGSRGGRFGNDDNGGGGFGGGNRGGRFGNDDNGGGGFGGRNRGGRFGNDDNGGGSFGGGGFGGGNGGRFGNDNGGNDDFGGQRRGGGGDFNGGTRGFGGGRGGRGGGGRFNDDGNGFGGNSEGGRFDRNGQDDGEGGPRKEPYIPPDVSTDEKDLFEGYSAGINFDKYEKIKVEVNGDGSPPAIDDFKTCDLRGVLVENVLKAKYTKPTPVQKYAIPIIKNGRDLMACAQTGSGKTAAFLLPIMHVLLESKESLSVSSTGAVEPKCLILSPTRELAMQIHKEALKFAFNTILKVGLIYGGTGSNHQMSKIASGCHIIVATPGRLGDFINRGKLSYEKIQFIVLDEADRMLDMGFQMDIERMMNHDAMPKPGSKTTVMFSATFPNEIQRIASKYLINYLYVVVGMVGGACSDVTQSFLQVPKFDKREKLVEMLRAEDPNHKVMVFTETKKTCDFVAAYLCEMQVSSTSIHGDREQPERESALRAFRQGKHRVLVATNVAARGIDIAGVHLVINYDLPKEVDDYVHRIGRTGRVGHTGNAISFFDDKYDQNLAPALIKILTQAEQNVPEWLLSLGGGGFMSGSSFGGGGHSDIRSCSAVQAPQAPPPAAAEDDEW
ncbi:uncharacterized protein LOC132198595 [Neocloeon triangulifer]|uniref:uncharacterized protein LOC132198595 n=1 Tax=Neocloeon triangulifer TaxID=2078957 RepID=UPI00286EC6AA|nr:uncharacterized protein LOC132198595 [Neocloeon triangulifer]